MKIHLLTCIGFFFIVSATAQPETVHFDYDAAGNRIMKYVFRSMNADETDSIVQLHEQLAPMLPEPEKETIHQEADGFVMFPNPADDYITLNYSTPEPGEEWTYRVFNMQGVEVISGKTNSFPVSLEFGNQSPGTYYLSITSGNRSKQFSIIKM